MSAPPTGPGGPVPAKDLLRALDLAAALEAQQADHRERVEPLVLAVVDALDTLDRLATAGLSTVEDGRGSLRGLARALEAALNRAGAEVTGRVGDAVDPGVARIVEVRPGTPETESGPGDEAIVAVVRRGCVYEGRVLRTAQVITTCGVADEIDRD